MGAASSCQGKEDDITLQRTHENKGKEALTTIPSAVPISQNGADEGGRTHTPCGTGS